MEPKATMPITPSMTIIVPCDDGVNEAVQRRRQHGWTHVYVRDSDGRSNEKSSK